MEFRENLLNEVTVGLPRSQSEVFVSFLLETWGAIKRILKYCWNGMKNVRWIFNMSILHQEVLFYWLIYWFMVLCKCLFFEFPYDLMMSSTLIVINCFLDYQKSSIDWDNKSIGAALRCGYKMETSPSAHTTLHLFVDRAISRGKIWD